MINLKDIEHKANLLIDWLDQLDGFISKSNGATEKEVQLMTDLIFRNCDIQYITNRAILMSSCSRVLKRIISDSLKDPIFTLLKK